MKRIKLTGKRGGEALVDDDKAWLSQYKWCRHSAGYAIRGQRSGGKDKIMFLHHAIIGQPLAGVVDHINQDKLDNRRRNLRFCSFSFNATNHKHPLGRGKYGRNVCYDANRNPKNPFSVKCTKDSRTIHGGDFATIEKAQEAAKKLRRKLGYANA